ARRLGPPAVARPQTLARGGIARRLDPGVVAARLVPSRRRSVGTDGPCAGAWRAHRRHPGRAGLLRPRNRRAARGARRMNVTTESTHEGLAVKAPFSYL